MHVRATSVVRTLTTSALVAVLTVGAAGCASGVGSGGSSSSGNPDQITREQIEENQNFSTAGDLIRQLRPRWLRSGRAPVGGPGSPTPGQAAEPVVFIDGVRFGELASLRNISLTNVDSMQYLDSRDATTLYGTGFQGGAILITMRRGL